MVFARRWTRRRAVAGYKRCRRGPRDHGGAAVGEAGSDGSRDTSQSVRCCRSACSWPSPQFRSRYSRLAPIHCLDVNQMSTGNPVPDPSRFGLCRLAALLRRLHSGHGSGRWTPSTAQRAIATLHSFRFFGLVFLLPGVVSPDLPAGFAGFAAYGDFATGVLAMLALLTVRIRPLFWLFVVAFNLVGTVDLIVDYYHAIQVDLPARRGSGRHLCDPDHLRAAADDHAHHRILFSAASAVRRPLAAFAG